MIGGSNPITIILRISGEFFLIFRIKTKSQATSFHEMFFNTFLLSLRAVARSVAVTGKKGSIM